MPTPVAVARQCLAEAAAAVLDDAVSVAKKRGHGQTTSLHAVSALISLPSSALREACARARSSAYSPRLQFRALELCVGVALDRISSTKSSASTATAGEEREPPPVSNSLMAAIKRSQANQRRHPDTFHLYQLTSSSQSISAVKVELKHFVISILDDPIVSRVFDDAGFRTHEIKLTILNPLAMSRLISSPTSRPPPPPLFLCSLRDFELNKPYADLDDNSRRIGEILLRQQNPLLIGACASDAYRNFIDSITHSHSELLPKEIANLKVASIEHDLSEFINGAMTEDSLILKLQQVAEDCQGCGIVAACGDLKKFLEAESAEPISFVIAEMKKVLSKPGGKFWLIGFLASDDIYSKLVKDFPEIEKDWDLHLLPITASIAGKSFKSSLMRSFVPFGGFFPMPSEIGSPSTAAVQMSTLCKSCNEKCEQEVDTVVKGQSTDPATEKQPVNLSSRLQIAEFEKCSKASCTVEVKEDNKALLNTQILGVRSKWSNICQRLHCSRKSPGEFDQPKLHTSTVRSFPIAPVWKDVPGMGSLSDLRKSPQAGQNNCKPVVSSTSVNARETNNSESQQMKNLPISYMSSQSLSMVTTDLKLGTFYNSAVDCRRADLQDHTNSAVDCRRIPNFQDHNSSGVEESSKSCEKSISPSLVSKSPSYSHDFKKYTYVKDLEHLWSVLAKKVPWQAEAVQTISRTISCRRNGSGTCRMPNSGNVWISFSGPDKVVKRKIAASVAEIVFGNKEHLLRIDLNARDMSFDSVDSIVDCYESQQYHKLKSGRKMIVDHLAEELRKHPHSVVLLENVEKADFLVRQSLFQAVRTGKFQDSYGRDININNVIFILASTTGGKASADPPFTSEFPEEKILEALNLQMQISVESSGRTNRLDDSRNVIVTLSSKRKLAYKDDSTMATMSKHVCCFPRSLIDLNLPVEDEDAEDTSEDDVKESLMWWEELLEHVDENVLFKPFDFDSLYKRVLKEIDVRIKKVVSDAADHRLEISRDAMAQILAAAWVADEEAALRDWIENVLCIGVQEAGRKRGGCDTVMKLTVCDGVGVKEEAPGIRLPARINVN